MVPYVDGFVFPIQRAHLSEYQQLAGAVAEIWKEHGALDYQEFLGDDLALEGTRSFLELTNAAEDEVVVFGWVSFPSKEARDVANARVASDPRVADLVASSDSGFDASRMVFGGFASFVGSPD